MNGCASCPRGLSGKRPTELIGRAAAAPVETLLILLGLTGGVMLIVALARILPELAMESPLELLKSFVPSGGEPGFFSLVHAHIREGWPDTKIDAVLFYGGISCLALVVATSLLRRMLD